VINVCSGYLFSVPNGNLVEVFEIPNPFFTNALEKLADQESLEKRDEKKCGKILGIPDSEFKVSATKII
jgi:hypothetical protein